MPLGFRLLRVSDDRPDQGQQYRSLVIAVREHDLVDIQLRTEHQQHQRPDPTATATSSSGESHQPASTADRFTEFTARDAMVRVFDRSTDVGSDDASDMYVLEVLGVSVLVRLRSTGAHPGSRPQLYVPWAVLSRLPHPAAAPLHSPNPKRNAAACWPPCRSFNATGPTAVAFSLTQ